MAGDHGTSFGVSFSASVLTTDARNDTKPGVLGNVMTRTAPESVDRHSYGAIETFASPVAPVNTSHTRTVHVPGLSLIAKGTANDSLPDGASSLRA